MSLALNLLMKTALKGSCFKDAVVYIHEALKRE